MRAVHLPGSDRVEVWSALAGGAGVAPAQKEIDEALSSLLEKYRSAQVDSSYSAYDRHPLDEPDEWGDLASFRDASSAT